MTQDRLDSLVRIEIDGPRMNAAVVLEPGLDESELSPEAVIGALNSRGVKPPADLAQKVGALIERYLADPGQTLREIVARGTPPAHGQDGRLELVQPESPPPAEQAEGKGSTCHYSRSAYRVVEPGEIIARLIPPTEGADGVDVTGRTLAAKRGKAFPATLTDGAEAGDDGLIRATRAGLLDFRPPIVGVRDTLEVPGFVDFSTGNIDFVGDVSVLKGVRDCFEVRVGGSLRVAGLVEAARVVADRDVVLAGGMASRHKGSATAGRDMAARYLTSAAAFAGRDLRVEKEILNSRVLVGRRLLADSCCIAGGVIAVTREAVVGTLGSVSGARTQVVLGRVEEIESLLARAAELLPRLEARAVKAQQALAQLKSVKGKLSASQAEQLTELEFEVATARQKIGPLEKRVEGLREVASRVAKVDLTVRRQIHRGVTLWFGTWSAEVNDDLRGPLRIGVADGEPFLEETARNVRVPLSKVARVINHGSFEGPPASLEAPEEPAETRRAQAA